MKLTSKSVFALIIASLATYGYGQGYIQYDYIPTSTLKDGLNNPYGSGNIQIMSGNCNIPLSVKHNAEKQPIVWNTTLRFAYATLENQGQAKELNPDDILNGSLNLTHIRPISKKWNLIASIGGGIYSPTNEISAKSILANGGIIFVYDLNRNLKLGAGIGVTNSYGVPMVMPMLYLSWQKTGKYEFKIDMSNGMKVSSSVWLYRMLKLELTALEVDGMSAVVNTGGQSRIYSTVMLRSHLSPSFHFNKHIELYASVGGNWLRGITLSERSMKGFFNAMKNDREEDKLRFDVALRVSTGVRFKF